MRFLPVFLDLQAGPVVLIGSGELAQAKLRVLAAAGARVRWYAAGGSHDLSALEPASVGDHPCGVWAWRPPVLLVESLSELFDRGAR